MPRRNRYYQQDHCHHPSWIDWIGPICGLMMFGIIALFIICCFVFDNDEEVKLANTKASENYEKVLRVAAESCSSEVVKFLVRNVVDIDSGKLGVTALHHAAEKNCLEVMRFLIEEGANINAADGFRWAPLHYAAKHGSLDAVKLLLEKGANPNAKNKDYATPLSIARNNKQYNQKHQDYVEIVRILSDAEKHYKQEQ